MASQDEWRRRQLEWECLEISRQMARTAAEAREIGGETLAELSRQTEQLNRVASNLHNVDAHNDEARWYMRSMGPWPARLWNKIRGTPTRAPVRVAHPTRQQSKQRGHCADAGPLVSTPHFAAAAVPAGAADETERNLDDVEKLLGEMRQIGLATRDELEAQARVIDVVDERTLGVRARIAESNSQVRFIR
eukprot:m51a1_g5767 putative synaptosomal-associated protein 25 isoform x2 (191) ;mRNA; r:1237382-1238094